MNMIVVEIVQSYDSGTPVWDGSAAGPGIGKRFQQVIADQHGSGYRLHSWRMTSSEAPKGGNTGRPLTETIVAVFEHVVDRIAP